MFERVLCSLAVVLRAVLRWVWNIDMLIMAGENRGAREINLYQCRFVNQKTLTWTGSGSNPGLHLETPPINCLRPVTAFLCNTYPETSRRPLWDPRNRVRFRSYRTVYSVHYTNKCCVRNLGTSEILSVGRLFVVVHKPTTALGQSVGEQL